MALPETGFFKTIVDISEISKKSDNNKNLSLIIKDIEKDNIYYTGFIILIEEEIIPIYKKRLTNISDKKERKKLLDKIRMLLIMQTFPAYTHLENLLLFPEFFSDEDLTTLKDQFIDLFSVKGKNLRYYLNNLELFRKLLSIILLERRDGYDSTKPKLEIFERDEEDIYLILDQLLLDNNSIHPEIKQIFDDIQINQLNSKNITGLVSKNKELKKNGIITSKQLLSVLQQLFFIEDRLTEEQIYERETKIVDYLVGIMDGSFMKNIYVKKYKSAPTITDKIRSSLKTIGLKGPITTPSGIDELIVIRTRNYLQVKDNILEELNSMKENLEQNKPLAHRIVSKTNPSPIISTKSSLSSSVDLSVPGSTNASRASSVDLSVPGSTNVSRASSVDLSVPESTDVSRAPSIASEQESSDIPESTNVSRAPSTESNFQISLPDDLSSQRSSFDSQPEQLSEEEQKELDEGLNEIDNPQQNLSKEDEEELNDFLNQQEEEQNKQKGGGDEIIDLPVSYIFNESNNETDKLDSSVCFKIQEEYSKFDLGKKTFIEPYFLKDNSDPNKVLSYLDKIGPTIVDEKELEIRKKILIGGKSSIKTPIKTRKSKISKKNKKTRSKRV